MENPNTWGKVKNTIADAIEQNNKDNKDGLIGYSLITKIYNALKEKGYVVEDTKE